LASYFFDSSALVKRYATERGSAWVESLTDPRTGNRIYLAAITHVEVVAAIARKRKGLLLSTTDAAAAVARFEHDLQSDL
jgi:predicted nucleic acid-binding protein